MAKSVDLDQFSKLEARVKALEDLKVQLDGVGKLAKVIWATAGFTCLGLVLGIINLVWIFATISRDVAHHEKEIARLEAKTDKIADRLQLKIDKITDRLQFWEDKGFRHVGVVPFDGTIVLFKDGVLVIAQDGNERKFTVPKDATVTLDGKSVDVKELGRLQGLPITLFLDNLNDTIARSIDVRSKKD